MVDKSSALILGMFSSVIVVCFSEVKLDSFDILLVSVVETKKGIALEADCFSEAKVDSFDTLLASVTETKEGLVLIESPKER